MPPPTFRQKTRQTTAKQRSFLGVNPPRRISFSAMERQSRATDTARTAALLGRVATESIPGVTPEMLTSTEFQKLVDNFDTEEIIENLGLQSDIDLELLVRNPQFLERLNPDSQARAKEWLDQLPKEPVAQEIPSAPTVRELYDKQNKEAVEQGFDPLDRTKGLFADPRLQKYTPEEQARLASRAFQIIREEQRSTPLGQIANFTSGLDVISETTAELFAQVPKILKGDFGALEAPTLIAPDEPRQGYQEALEDFQARPIAEQMALSLLDPSLVFGGGKFAARILLGNLGRIAATEVPLEAARVALRRKTAAEFARMTAEEAVEAGGRDVAQLTTFPEALAQVRPSRLSKIPRIPGVRQALDFIDPSAKIHTLTRGSTERTILEGSVAYNRLLEQGQKFVEITMSVIKKEVGDVQDLFGISKKVSNLEPRALFITHGIRRVASRPMNVGETVSDSGLTFFREPISIGGASRYTIDSVKGTYLLRAVPSADDPGVLLLDIATEGIKYSSAIVGPAQGFVKEELRAIARRLGQDFPEYTKASGLRFTTTREVSGKFASANLDEFRPALTGSQTFKLKEAPFFGNVFENRNAFQMTAQQRAWIDRTHTILDESLIYFKKSGVNVEELGKLEDSFYFFPRRLKDAAGNVTTRLVGAGNRARIGAHRTLLQMEDDKLGLGFIYDGPNDVLRSYLKTGYKEVSRLKLEKHLDEGGLFRPSIIPEAILSANKVAKDLVKRQFKAVTAVRAMLRDFVPAGQTVVAMKRAFPQLSQYIDAVIQLRPVEIEQLVKRVATEALTAAKITRTQLRDALINADGRFGAAARELNLTTAQEVKLQSGKITKSEKIYKEDRRSQIRALMNRMDEWRPRAVSELADTSKAKADYRKGGHLQEGRAPSINPNLILRDWLDETGKVTSTGREVAARLEKVFSDTGSPIWRPISNMNAVVRRLRTTLDFGAPLIQGLPILFSNPGVWAEATKAQFMAFKNPAVRSNYIAGNAVDIVEMVKYGGQLGSSEFTEATIKGGWFANIGFAKTSGSSTTRILAGGAEKGLGFVQAIDTHFSSSFEMFLDTSRIEMWKALRPLAKTEGELADLASFVNKISGVTSSRALGVPLSQREFEAAIPFFSPRYTRASIGIMIDMFNGGMRAGLAQKTMAHLFFGMAAMHVATQQMLDQPIRLDPSRPAEFMRTDFFETRVGFGGAPATNLKIAAKIFRQAVENPEGFLHWNIFDAEDYLENKIISSARNKFAPLTGTVLSIITGADPLGNTVPGLNEPIELFKWIGTQALPFWGDAVIEGTSGLGKAIGGAAEATGGIAFNIPAYANRDNLLEKYSQTEFSVSLEELKLREFAGREDIRMLRNKYPDLEEAFQIVISEQGGKKLQQDRATVTTALTDIKKDWVEAGWTGGNNYISQVGGTRFREEFRQSIKIMNAVKRDANQRLRDDFEKVFDNISEYYDELAEDFPELAAESEFFDRVTSDEVVHEETGKVDYVALEALRDDIDRRYGDGTMDKIDRAQFNNQTTLLEGKLHPVHQEFIRSYSALRPYWNAYKEVLPEDEWKDWQYFDQFDDIGQEAILRSREGGYYRRMQQQVDRERKQIKKDDKDIDMLLLQFYGLKSTNWQNIEEARRRVYQITQGSR